MTRVRPGDVWLLLRMAAWAVLLPALKFLLPLPRLVRLLTPAAAPRPRDPDLEHRVARVAARLYRLPKTRDNCLERSLVTYRYLTRLNAEPRLVVGMRREDALRGHVWVTVDGRPVHDAPDYLAGFVPIMSFPQT